MDLDILQHIRQLFALWNNKQQHGTLQLSTQHLSWTNSDGQEVDLLVLLQPTTQTLPPLDDIPNNKNYKRLKLYFDLGKQLHLEPDKAHEHSIAMQRTAQRVYDFYQLIGEQHIGRHATITPSFLYRLTNNRFEDYKLEILTNLVTFGGPQAGEGDDLLAI
jgi:hypothetical protein